MGLSKQLFWLGDGAGGGMKVQESEFIFFLQLWEQAYQRRKVDIPWAIGKVSLPTLREVAWLGRL